MVYQSPAEAKTLVKEEAGAFAAWLSLRGKGKATAKRTGLDLGMTLDLSGNRFGKGRECHARGGEFPGFASASGACTE